MADRLEIAEERLRRAFILEILTLPNRQLAQLAQLNPLEPDALTTEQADIIVGCLERAADRVSRERRRQRN